MAHASHQTNVNAFMDLNQAQMPISHASPVNPIRTVTNWKPVQPGIINVNAAVLTIFTLICISHFLNRTANRLWIGLSVLIVILIAVLLIGIITYKKRQQIYFYQDRKSCILIF